MNQKMKVLMHFLALYLDHKEGTRKPQPFVTTTQTCFFFLCCTFTMNFLQEMVTAEQGWSYSAYQGVP
jgi:hypothetical protein